MDLGIKQVGGGVGDTKVYVHMKLSKVNKDIV